MAALKKGESPLCPVDDVKSHHMTLLPFISASGRNLEKLHILSTVECFSRMPKFAAHSNNFVFHKTKNGWITRDTLHKIFVDHVIPEIQQRRIQDGKPNYPAVFITDGHSSRYSLPLLDILRENYIHLVIIPSHASHLMQPLDLVVFKRFKTVFREAYRKQTDSFIKLCLGDVPTTTAEKRRVKAFLAIKEAWACSSTARFCADAFFQPGLYEFNPKALLDEYKPDRVFYSASKRGKNHITGVLTHNSKYHTIRKLIEEHGLPKSRRVPHTDGPISEDIAMDVSIDDWEEERPMVSDEDVLDAEIEAPPIVEL